MAHWSSCPTNNAPALPAGPCNCGNDAPEEPYYPWPDFEQKFKERFPEGVTPISTPFIERFIPRANPKRDAKP